MIITQKKPIDELMAMLGDAQKIAILGCGSCATMCPDCVITVER